MQFLRSVLGGSGGGKELPFTLAGGDGSGGTAAWGGWMHYAGNNKEDNAAVSVFCLSASNANDARLPAGRNNAKRLRTLRHPNILSFVNSVEVEKEEGGVSKPVLYIVTEPVVPLVEKLKELQLQGRQRDEYFAWGLHQIAKAVNFLNNDCKLVHGNICMASVVVTPSLDWKLHAFDVLSEFDASPDAADGPMLPFEWMVGAQYKPMEVAKGDWAAVRRGPAHAIDAWGLGCFIHEIFAGTPLVRTEELRQTACIPKTLLPDYQRLLGSVPSRRMNPSKLLDNSEFFQTKLVDTVQFMEVLNLKDSNEKEAFFRKLPSLAEQLPRPIVLKKVLPQLSSSLEFGSAPAAGLTCLLKLASWMPKEEFDAKVLPTLVKLFGSGDRAVRIALLQNLDSFAASLSPSTVEDQVFNNLCSGFTDSSAFLRELTLKSVLTLAPKLSQRTLGGALLKHLSKLQVDEEAAIRTNTTILLGNIARHLNDATRKRVLVNAFTVRALRDAFPPARAAGIMALMATKEYYDATEIATRILPPLVVLTVDADIEVRSKAHEASLAFLHSVNDLLTRAPQEAEAAAVDDSSVGLLGWAVSSLTSSSAAASKPAAATAAAPPVPVGASVPKPSATAAAPQTTTAAVAALPSKSFSSSSASTQGFSNGGKAAERGEWDDEDDFESQEEEKVASVSLKTVDDNDDVHEDDNDGWDDLDDSPSSAPAASASLSRIQAAQQRPVLAGAAARPKPQATPAIARKAPVLAEDEDFSANPKPAGLPGVKPSAVKPSVVKPSLVTSSAAQQPVPSQSAASQPRAAASASRPSPSLQPTKAALQPSRPLVQSQPLRTPAASAAAKPSDDPFADIAAPVPVSSARPLVASSGAAAAGGRGRAPAVAVSRASSSAAGHVKLPASASMSLDSMLGNSMDSGPAGRAKAAPLKLGAQRLQK